MQRWADTPSRLATFAGVVLLLGTLDIWRILTGRYASTGLARQTPRRRPGRRPTMGILVWGLDTGVPLTTVRASSLPFIGIAGVALGFGTWWVGLAYSAGHLGILIWLSLAHYGSTKSHDTTSLLLTLQHQRNRARAAGVVSSALVITLLLRYLSPEWLS